MAKDKDFTVSQRFHNRYGMLLDQTVAVTLENGRTVTGIFADEIYEDASVLISIPSGNAVETLRIAEIRQMEPADRRKRQPRQCPQAETIRQRICQAQWLLRPPQTRGIGQRRLLLRRRKRSRIFWRVLLRTAPRRQRNRSMEVLQR